MQDLNNKEHKIATFRVYASPVVLCRMNCVPAAQYRRNPVIANGKLARLPVYR
jgi:hypothetical protein